MSPMRFNRVAIIANGQIVELGVLTQTIQQSDLTFVYEIRGDSGKIFTLREDSFIYIQEETDETEWLGF